MTTAPGLRPEPPADRHARLHALPSGGTVPSGAATPSGAAQAGARRRRELADFLRSRRERLTPDQVGLPHTGRRRTPGLRREEVAALAGVGVTWYTWLEQARDVTPSPQVVDAVARALHLDEHERAHLYVLAGQGTVRPSGPAPDVPDSVRQILRGLEPFPAVLSNARYDLLAYNRTYRFAVADLDEIPRGDRNTLWLMSTHPAWRAATVAQWEENYARLVSQFRAAMAEHMNEPAWRCLLQRLREASPEFAEIWDRRDVSGPQAMVKTLISPRAGRVRLLLSHLWLDTGLSRRISVYTPLDAESHQRLEALLASVS